MTVPTFTTLRLDLRPDGVGLLTFDQPASNANVLTDQVWADFEAAIDHLAGRTDVQGLVLASAKPGIFIAGADLKLLGNANGPNDPTVRAFIDRGNRTLFKLEALPFPTCAAINGAALGGGCEVALACDTRVFGTHPRTELSFPEVKIGLVPGWGGTQRLPRLIGPIKAFDVIREGVPLPKAGVVDVTVDSGGLTGAASAALSFMDWQRVRKTRLSTLPPDQRMPDENYQNAIKTISGSPGDLTAARLAVLDLIFRGGSLPLREAIALETEAFMQLAGSPESKRLIADFFAARKK